MSVIVTKEALIFFLFVIKADNFHVDAMHTFPLCIHTYSIFNFNNLIIFMADNNKLST